MIVADHLIRPMVKAGFEALLKSTVGQRVDKRSLKAGYYAAAALMASAHGRDESLVADLVGAATDAICRVD